MTLFRQPFGIKQIILAGSLLVTLASACAPNRSVNSQLGKIARHYYFSIAGWEIDALPQTVKLPVPDKQKNSDQTQIVVEYFTNVRHIASLDSSIQQALTINQTDRLTALEAERAELQKQNGINVDAVERTLAGQIRDALSAEGIYNPWVNVKAGFPPVIFTLESLPYLLVVSPRDRIEPMRKIMLQPTLTLTQMETIEDKVDKLGVSSLVSDIGGLGATYPTLVSNEASLSPTINAAAHEWTHQYLAFKPLGFLYLLDLTGVRRDYDIATMNETLASIIGDEVGGLVYQKYYAQYEAPPTPISPTALVFDFDTEMRRIRQTVDAYLAEGKIDEAEQYMTQQRDYLATKGYYIRKLNQAYFAFHGTYAESSASSNPIGPQMQRLRAQSPSLKDFLNKAAAITSPRILERSLK